MSRYNININCRQGKEKNKVWVLSQTYYKNNKVGYDTMYNDTWLHLVFMTSNN